MATSVTSLQAVIAALDAEIERLQQARALLVGSGATTGATTPQTTPATTRKVGGAKKGHISPEAKRRLSEMMKKKWAERKRALAKANR